MGPFVIGKEHKKPLLILASVISLPTGTAWLFGVHVLLGLFLVGLCLVALFLVYTMIYILANGQDPWI